jgi:riboflavin kinase/FMN adenylyltransferase
LKIYYDIKDFSANESTITTIGTFDGVHAGHKKIINVLTKIASTENKESVLITFQPHPQLILNPKGYNIKLINTLEEKEALLDNAGIDNLVMIPFTKEFAKTDAETFVKDFLIGKINTSNLVVGYDHHFGKNRSGEYTTLVDWGKKYGFENTYVDPIVIDGFPVSSTKIRNALAEGNINKANTLLGYCFSLSGRVVEGNKIGRKIGFPTANIETGDIHKIIPANGIYVVNVKTIIGEYFGMCNIGLRPTFNFTNRIVEVNIFDFNFDIYDNEITIEFIERLRDEIKFDNVDKLVQQINNDKLQSLKIINNLK